MQSKETLIQPRLIELAALRVSAREIKGRIKVLDRGIDFSFE
jgi:hypothetical protein